MEPAKIIYIAILFTATIILHEFTHWLALKKMGGSGRIGICKGSFKIPTIGVRYTGGLQNWRQVVFFKAMPIPVTFICFYYMSSVIVDPSGLSDKLGWFLTLVFACGLTWVACNKDYFDIRLILLKGNEMNFEECFKPEGK